MSSVLLDKPMNNSLRSRWKIVESGLQDETLGRVAGQVPNQQIPAGPRESLPQWPTDEPYSVIASNELGLCETMLGKEFPSTLTSINNLAAVLRDQGKYDLAEEMYRQGLRLCETILGQDHPSTLTSTSNLALVLRGQGKYEQAEETYRQALGLIETVLGKDVEKAAGKRSLNHGHL